MSCQTCYSEIIPSRTSTSSSIAAYYTPCCNTLICEKCISRNPRLREYNPCLRCGDVKSSEGLVRIREGKRQVERERAEEEAGRFTIGDSEDEEEGDDSDRPPSYSEETPKSNDPFAMTKARDPTHPGVNGSTPPPKVEDEMEVVEVTHPIGKNDTLMSIARKYAADPHDLITLNNLPPTSMTSNPRIVQTRSKLIISQRRIPKGSIPDDHILFEYPGEPLNQEEALRREEERRIKRFQLITKMKDPGVGKAYLGLAELDEGRDVLSLGSGEVLDLKGEGGGQGKKKVLKEGNREDRALEAFWDDQDWEREVGKPERVKVDGRWTVVGSGRSLGLGLGLQK